MNFFFFFVLFTVYLAFSMLDKVTPFLLSQPLEEHKAVLEHQLFASLREQFDALKAQLRKKQQLHETQEAELALSKSKQEQQ